MSQARCKVAAIVAFAVKGRGIGRGGELPWRLKEDMKYFKEVTTKVSTPGKRNAVVMGRNTWASIPQRFRPLQDRLNVVLSRTPAETRRKLSVPLAVPILSSLQDAVEALNLESDIETVYVIGGASLYDEALKMGIDELHATLVEGDFADCDVFFPEIPSYLEEVSTSEPVSDANATFTVKVFSKSNESLNPANVSGSPTAASMPRPVAPPTSRVNPDHEEYQYLDLVREIIEKGVDRGDRTGTGTRSVFGRTMRFNLRDGTLPLLTTKRVFWRGVAEELLWFVSGDTSAKSLQEKNIHIWDGNGSREYLDKIGLTDREEGDLGPVYGFQWRHFGAEYKTMHDDYTGQGVDQLASLVEKLKTNPNDRRMIISAWNPAAFHLMALPPCHMFAQFYVANGELSCQMYQRSADMGLGVPFNIASYSLLTHMLAQCTGLKPGEFIHVIGDTHVYSNHIEPLKEQIDRTPTDFPKLVINTANTDIDGFKYSDFEVVGYNPQKSIKMEMSV